MKFARVLAYINSQSWAILPEKIHAIADVLEHRILGPQLTEEELEARLSAFVTPPGQAQAVAAGGGTGVAVIRIHGTIANRMSMLTEASGGISSERVGRALDEALSSPRVSAIVLDIDSPGGVTDGTEELAAKVRAGRAEKPIVAVASAMAASAAYWIGSAASEFSVTPSGHVGSIGVMGVHLDVSEKARKEGVTVSLVTAGKHKAEASEFTPLSDEARAHMQALVDDRYEAFVADVAAGRRVSAEKIRNGFGEGRLVPAKAALREGMVDRIETLDEAIVRAGAGEVPRVSATGRRIRGEHVHIGQLEGVFTGTTEQAAEEVGRIIGEMLEADPELGARVRERVLAASTPPAPVTADEVALQAAHDDERRTNANDPHFALQEAELAELEHGEALAENEWRDAEARGEVDGVDADA